MLVLFQLDQTGKPLPLDQIHSLIIWLVILGLNLNLLMAGNDFFIDNINLSGSVSIDENEFNQNTVHPNPVKDNINISFNSTSKDKSCIRTL